MRYIKFLFIIPFVVIVYTKNQTISREIYSREFDFNVVFAFDTCSESSNSQTLIDTAIWIVDRLNFLNFLPSLKLGLVVYETCTESDLYNAIFNSFQRYNEYQIYLVGIVTDRKPKEQIRKTSQALNINIVEVDRNLEFLVSAVIDVILALELSVNITVEAPEDVILRKFSQAADKKQLCIESIFKYTNVPEINESSNTFFVIFGESWHLKKCVENLHDTNSTVFFVPLDGSSIEELPPNSIILVPPHSLPTQKQSEFLPSPLLLGLASPILNLLYNVQNKLLKNCYNTNVSYKINCLKTEILSHQIKSISINSALILDALKLEPLSSDFIYNIFKVDKNESGHAEKIYTYSIFNENLTSMHPMYTMKNRSLSICENKVKKNEKYSERKILHVRTEPWVFAFLSLSLLGVIFCFVILVFLLISIFNGNSSEGNPVMSILLLIVVMLMFCSILPLSLDGTKKTLHSICLARFLSITLSYSAAFSLILSRTILLATTSKEVGFMTHVSGPVQAFLCLFSFGVQCAIDLRVFDSHCIELFHGNSFLYLMSYNTMLLLLILCFCPLIYYSKRNYREGKSFVWSTIIICVIWIVWLSCYGTLGAEWKEPVMSFGLIMTGSTILGTVFIPRTYKMMVEAERNRRNGNIPSLVNESSVLDIYRAGSQPIYDCVNLSAISAVTLARASLSSSMLQNHHQQKQTENTSSNSPKETDDVEDSYNEHHNTQFFLETPLNLDKVTRF